MLEFLMPEKQCFGCKQVLPLAQFNKHKGRHTDGLSEICKACKKERARTSYLKNKAKVNAANRARAKAHPEQVRAANKAYYAVNKAKHYASHVEWMKSHKHEQQAWQKNYHAQRRKTDPSFRAQIAEVQRRRRGRLQSRVTRIIRPHELDGRAAVFGNKCAYCPGPFEHWDHVKPIYLGGAHILSNLRPACAKCNLTKGRKSPSVWFARMREINVRSHNSH